jgi:hypothetical protein
LLVGMPEPWVSAAMRRLANDKNYFSNAMKPACSKW